MAQIFKSVSHRRLVSYKPIMSVTNLLELSAILYLLLTSKKTLLFSLEYLLLPIRYVDPIED